MITELGHIPWLELLSVEHSDFLLIEKDDEDRIGHEVDLVDLFVRAVVAIEFDRLGLFVHVEQLNDFVPCNRHQRHCLFALLGRKSVAPVDGWDRLLFAHFRSINSLKRPRRELSHLYDCDHIGGAVSCQATGIAEGREVTWQQARSLDSDRRGALQIRFVQTVSFMIETAHESFGDMD